MAETAALTCTRAGNQGARGARRHAKNHLSEVVDDAEHRGVATVILRHGKPCAAVVPLAMARLEKPKPRLTDEQWEALLAKAASYDNPAFSAARDIREGRDKR